MPSLRERVRPERDIHAGGAYGQIFPSDQGSAGQNHLRRIRRRLRAGANGAFLLRRMRQELHRRAGSSIQSQEGSGGARFLRHIHIASGLIQTKPISNSDDLRLSDPEAGKDVRGHLFRHSIPV